MGAHIIDGEFQSDKYPTCPSGKVPLSVKDPTAQDLLWEYAQRRRAVDAEFSEDLETALKNAGFVPPFIAHCTCGANAACAGMNGPPPHKEDCELNRRFSERTVVTGFR
jgi:hypothetical protein